MNSDSALYSKIDRSISFLPTIQLISFIRGRASSPSRFANAVMLETSTDGHQLAGEMIRSKLYQDWSNATINLKYSVARASEHQYQYSDGLHQRHAATIPVVRAACSNGTDLAYNSGVVPFPVLPEFSPWTQTRIFNMSTTNVTVNENLRTTWVVLPPSFGSVSTGLLLEGPTRSDNLSRLVVGCSIDARWTPGALEASANGDGGASIAAANRNQTLWENENSNFVPAPNSNWHPIVFQQSWLDVLAPLAPDQQNLTTLEVLIQSSGLVEDLLPDTSDQVGLWDAITTGGLYRSVYLEYILSLVVADGLSRHGTSRAINTTGPLSDWSILDYKLLPDYATQIFQGYALERPDYPDLQEFISEISITGYSFCYLGATTDKLAIAVLITHMCMALLHTAYLLLTRESSDAWDSVAEWLVLAQTSRPSVSALKNSSAGIKHPRTFARIGKIRASASRGASEHEHLELEFDSESEDEGCTSVEEICEKIPTVEPEDKKIHSTTWPLLLGRRSPSKDMGSVRYSTSTLDVENQDNVSIAQ